MFWLVVIGFGACFYYIYKLEKRFNELVSTRGQGSSDRFSVDASKAVTEHPKLAELIGIKSVGKPYSKWSQEDKEKWEAGLGQKIRRSAMVNITYLASENAFFVSPYNDDNPYIVLRDGTSNYIYSKIIAGDEDRTEAYLELEITDRLVKQDNGKYEWLISVALEYSSGFMAETKEDFQLLSEYPFLAPYDDEEFKRRGFDVVRRGGDDIYTDAYGKPRSVPTELKYSKNGVTIKQVI